MIYIAFSFYAHKKRALINEHSFLSQLKLRFFNVSSLRSTLTFFYVKSNFLAFV